LLHSPNGGRLTSARSPDFRERASRFQGSLA
jgi:hypothetical protein